VGVRARGRSGCPTLAARSEQGDRDPPMTIPHYPHRRVPWDAEGRSQARPHGDAHPRARGRGPGISPPWPSAARVASRPRRGATLLRPTPRPGYRVYSEEEFLAAEECSGQDARDLAAGRSTIGGGGEARSRGRVAAAAALAAAATAMAGVVAMNAARSRAGTERRFAGAEADRGFAGGVAPEAYGEGGSASSPTADRGSSDADPRRHPRARRASMAMRRVAERHPLLALAPPRAAQVRSRLHSAARTAISPAATAATAPPTPAVASSASATTPAPSPAAPSAAPASPATVSAAPASPASASAAPAPTATAAATTTAGRARPEFGFER
jgi:hypothetical protein